jgi:hypothetical protein
MRSMGFAFGRRRVRFVPLVVKQAVIKLTRRFRRLIADEIEKWGRVVKPRRAAPAPGKNPAALRRRVLRLPDRAFRRLRLDPLLQPVHLGAVQPRLLGDFAGSTGLRQAGPRPACARRPRSPSWSTARGRRPPRASPRTAAPARRGCRGPSRYEQCCAGAVATTTAAATR